MLRCVAPSGLPALGVSQPPVDICSGAIDRRINAEPGSVATELLQILPNPLHPAFGLAVKWHAGKEPVHQAADPLDRHRAEGTAPDRDWLLHRQGVDAGIADGMVPALKGDQPLRPQLAQDVDLLCKTSAAAGEVLTERFIFHRIPADANAKAQASAG